MNASALIDRLAAMPGVISPLITALPDGDLRHKSPTGGWSILEILCHLADEEVDDFRTRLRSTLQTPEQDWNPIDPEGWAKARRYNEQDPAAVLSRFVREREASVVWLRGLGEVDWNQAHRHPRFGKLRAGDLLGAWAAHDALHLRQIAKRIYELAPRDAQGFTVAYAGEWGP